MAFFMCVFKRLVFLLDGEMSLESLEPHRLHDKGFGPDDDINLNVLCRKKNEINSQRQAVCVSRSLSTYPSIYSVKRISFTLSALEEEKGHAVK